MHIWGQIKGVIGWSAELLLPHLFFREAPNSIPYHRAPLSCRLLCPGLHLSSPVGRQEMPARDWRAGVRRSCSVGSSLIREHDLLQQLGLPHGSSSHRQPHLCSFTSHQEAPTTVRVSSKELWLLGTDNTISSCSLCLTGGSGFPFQLKEIRICHPQFCMPL